MCDCCDPTHDSPDPVAVRIERENEELHAEVERLNTAWRAIDRANESLRERLDAATTDIDRLNQMLRKTGYGQGQIDSYAAECEEHDRCKERLAAAEAVNEHAIANARAQFDKYMDCNKAYRELQDKLDAAEAFVSKHKCGTCGGVRVKEAELCQCSDEAAKAAGGRE